MLAFYALKNAKVEDVVFLNNHIHEYEGMSISSVCSTLGIHINESHFFDNVILAIVDYIKQIQIIKDKNLMIRERTK